VFLLDTNIPANPPALRMITGRLYEADRTLRLQQEILLGIGGFRALVALGYDPVVCHMNEGHAAFASIGRLEHLMKHKGFDLETAIEIVARTGIFTTHTPLPAGHEYFAVELVKSQLQPVLSEIGIDINSVIEWGQSKYAISSHEICMTILGFKMSRRHNGVSKLHGRVTRKMWKYLWPDFPENEIPITHITNGIHVLSWLSPDMADLFDRYLGPDWRDHPSSNEVLSRVDQIPDDELWHAHEISRSRLIRFARDMIEHKSELEGANRAEIARFKSALHHEALTIGFARRFAEYKRATLLLKNPERLSALLSNRDRPVQIIFAGKAHPADNRGKEMIKQLVHFAKSSAGLHRLVFLENFDMYLARYMVQGCDIWLNTPRRPQEASGTSGMKAAVNGVLHVSTLDGWWDEAYHPECGWAIGKGETYNDPDYQDEVESQALFNLLENEIIPAFFDRSDGETPVRWTKMMKASIKLILSRFTSHRMISEYNTMFYKPSMEEYKKLMADNGAYARALVERQKRLNKLWSMVKLEVPVTQTDVSFMHVGDKFKIRAILTPGEIKPEELIVQVFYGPVDVEYGIREGNVIEMRLVGKMDDKSYIYEQELECKYPGRYGFTVRVLPAGTEWLGMIPGYISWPTVTS
jgi:starch phosphorylase